MTYHQFCSKKWGFIHSDLTFRKALFIYNTSKNSLKIYHDMKLIENEQDTQIICAELKRLIFI